MPREKQLTRTSPERELESARTACTLDRVPAKERAEVLNVAGEDGIGRRLAQLGIMVGAVLHVQRTAPWGGPILLDVQGGTVAVGRGLARRVSVRVLPPAVPVPSGVEGSGVKP